MCRAFWPGMTYARRRCFSGPASRLPISAIRKNGFPATNASRSRRKRFASPTSNCSDRNRPAPISFTSLEIWGKTTSEAPSLMAALQLPPTPSTLCSSAPCFDIVRRPKHVYFMLALSRRQPSRTGPACAGLAGGVAQDRAAGGRARCGQRPAGAPNCEKLRGLEEFLGTAIEFDCEHDAVVIDREVLSARPRRAPPHAALHIDSARDVSTLIREMLPYERPDQGSDLAIDADRRANLAAAPERLGHLVRGDAGRHSKEPGDEAAGRRQCSACWKSPIWSDIPIRPTSPAPSGDGPA